MEAYDELAVHGQRYLDPPLSMAALADDVLARGGTVREGLPVQGVDAGDRVVVSD